MIGPTSLYRPSLGLLTDLYQLTMAYGYYKSGVSDWQAIFHPYFRQNPFAGGYALAAGPTVWPVGAVWGQSAFCH